MTSGTSQENPVQQPESKQNDKEFNFRALQAKYEKELQQEKAARQEAERLVKEATERSKPEVDEDYDSEPYIDHRRLEKKLSKFGQTTQGEIQKAMEMAKRTAKEELKQEMWLESKPDFYDILQHADKFSQMAPEVASSILKMPDNFDRQKLVYEAIKAMGAHKPPEEKKSGIQDKINANQRNPYYQPSGVGSAPYASQGDFSKSGQQQAYEKLKQLKSNLRLG